MSSQVPSPPSPITVLELHGSPDQRGLHHGRRMRRQIRQMDQIRMDLFAEAEFSIDHLRQIGKADLDRLGKWPDLHQELTGIARGAGLPDWRVMLLNNFTDTRDLPAAPTGCTCLASLSPEPIAGQTWDMGGGVEDLAVMLVIDAPPAPRACLLSHAGGIGMMGVNAAGLAVMVNNLRSRRTKADGMPWPALVRRMLTQSTPDSAVEILRHNGPQAGRQFLCCSSTEMIGMEVDGVAQRSWTRADDRWAVHTNHYLTELSEHATTAPEAFTSAQRLEVARELLSDDSHRRASVVCDRLFGRALPEGVVVRGEQPGQTQTVAGWFVDFDRAHLRAWTGTYTAETCWSMALR